MNTEIMAPRKNKRNEVGRAIAQSIIEQYQPQNAQDMQNAIKDIFGPMFEAMLQGEMDDHLGYESNDHGYKATSNRRNGYTNKTLKTTMGDIDIQSPRDRDGSFEPQIVPKRSRDVSGIEDKVLAMYAKGMSQRDIADTIEQIYGFEISAEMISNINGIKDILGIWIGEAEGKHYWMQIFDEIKSRGVEDVLFISMDGVSGLEEGARSIFKDVVVQRCIVHLIRNSIKYIPSKDYKAYTSQLKKVYGAVSLKAAMAEFDRFKQNWSKYPGAVDVWVRNWNHVEQLFNYGSAVRKVMYTTNAIESVNSSFRKVTKKGSFPSEDSVLKALYLRITELYKKWNNRPVSNWALVRNQLAMDENMQKRIMRYEKY